MLTRTLLSSPLLVALLGIAPHLAGCLDTTIVGGEGGGGSGDEPPAVVSTAAVGVGTSGGGTGGATSASAWLELALDDATRGAVCMSDACQGDDMLFLFVDAAGSSCADPFNSDLPSDMGPVSPPATTWTVAIGVPPASQEVGVHPLDDSFILTSGEAVAGQSGPSTAGVTTGAAFMGTLEILELSDTMVRFVATGLDKPSDGVEYSAPRCGAIDLPPEGIAIAGDAIGGGGEGGGGEGGGAGGGGPSAGEDGLTFVVGNELATCTDTLATTCTGDTWQVAVSLPGDYVTPGLYALTDPRITVTNCTAQPKFLGGTIEVLDVDDAEVVIRFADVVDHQAELEQELRIERCP